MVILDHKCQARGCAWRLT